MSERILTPMEAGIRAEVIVWLEENCIGTFWLEIPYIHFSDHRDLVHFAMRWG